MSEKNTNRIPVKIAKEHWNSLKDIQEKQRRDGQSMTPLGDMVDSAVESWLDAGGSSTAKPSQSSVKSDTLSDYSREELEVIEAVIQMMRADDQELWPMVRRGIKIWRTDRAHERSKEAKESDVHRGRGPRGRRSA